MTESTDDPSCTLLYLNLTRTTLFCFESVEDKDKWEQSVAALKYEIAHINDAYPIVDSQNLTALTHWMRHYNAFVERWTLQKTPDDIVTARDSIADGLQSEGWAVPE